MPGPETGMQLRLLPAERRAASGLAAIYAARMLGLFMILPVFALHAGDLAGATPVLIGIAIGAYGLTQALLQIPFGMLSDRLGRKRVISVGLLIFAAGSVVAALADSIVWMILGRALQGAGAVAAAIMALVADLTREEIRLRVMALIGASIGGAFALAMILGPVLDRWFGLSGVFWSTACLALLALATLWRWVPDPISARRHHDAEPVVGQMRRVLVDAQLLRLDAGIFALHAILTATFVAVPLLLRDDAHLPPGDHWLIYLSVLLGSFITIVPFVIMAEKYRRLRAVFLGAIVVLGLAQLGLLYADPTALWLGVLLWVFFSAFNLLEAALPSLIAKTSPPEAKGTAMGVYSSAQFLGAFTGGALGGLAHGEFGGSGVFVLSTLLALVWLGLAWSMKNPRYLATQVVRLDATDGLGPEAIVARLTGVRGVAEAVVLAEDGVAYLKVDRHALDYEGLSRLTLNEPEVARDSAESPS